MAMITKYYDQAKDKNVALFVVYGKTADKKVYYDTDYTTQVEKADLEDAFKKGRLMIYDGTNYLLPVSLTAGKVKTVGMGSSAVELTEWASKA